MGERMRVRSVVVVVIAVALAVGACSDDTTTDDAGSASRGTTTTEGSVSTTAPAGPLERYAGYASVDYDDPAHWLCRPGVDDICAGDLDATVVAADGSLTPEPFVEADDPAVDCFYVYPTISRDPGRYSDWDASDQEEGYAALNQVARLRSVCRVFAPVYRQQTLAGLGRALGGSATTQPEQGDPFADVLDAWKTYMANDNDGRGVILVGHSQGAAMLNQLVAKEIDPNDDVRARLVSAFLVGWAVGVPDGEDVGGEFEHVPLCRDGDQVGCVATWASFRATAPPPAGSFFGMVRGRDDLVAGCTNPAALAGGSAELHNYFPSNPDSSILAALGSSIDSAAGWGGDSPITTPFVSLPGLVSGECVDDGSGHHVLSVTVHADPGPRADDIGGDLTPEWGLHLVDLTLTMGDVVDLAATQSTAWLADRS